MHGVTANIIALKRMMRPPRDEPIPIELREVDFGLARVSAFLNGAVKKTPSPRGPYKHSQTGERYDAERLPLCRAWKLLWSNSLGPLTDYKLSVSACLLLRFLLEMAVVLVAMGLISMPLLVSNVRRNRVRNLCRRGVEVIRRGRQDVPPPR